MHNAPPLLFVPDALIDDDRRAVAIVGTRSPSEAGRALAGRLAADAVESGYAVGSGLAAGIDTPAHAAALNAGVRTIAFSGTDIERVYPVANRALATAIRGSGACVSQFLPGTDSLVTDQAWATEMAHGPGNVTVVRGAEEMTQALDDHLAIIADDSLAYA